MVSFLVVGSFRFVSFRFCFVIHFLCDLIAGQGLFIGVELRGEWANEVEDRMAHEEVRRFFASFVSFDFVRFFLLGLSFVLCSFLFSFSFLHAACTGTPQWTKPASCDLIPLSYHKRTTNGENRARPRKRVGKNECRQETRVQIRKK